MKGQEAESPKNQRVKYYKETEVYQKRSAKSSKFVQDRAWKENNHQLETEIDIANRLYKDNQNVYRNSQIVSSDSNKKRYKIEKENSVQKENRDNIRERSNMQSYHRNRNNNRSLDYIALLVQNLEEKLSELGINGPNRS